MGGCTPSHVFTEVSPSPSPAKPRPRPLPRARSLSLILTPTLCIAPAEAAEAAAAEEGTGGDCNVLDRQPPRRTRAAMAVDEDLYKVPPSSSVRSPEGAWRSVFTACRRDLLSSMPPLAVHEDHAAYPAVKAEGRWRLEGREPPLGAARLWARAGILGASHGHLFVVDADAERSRSQIFLLEAVAAVTGEETPVIRLPWIPLDPYYLDVLLTAHPASPQCVVAAPVNENLLLCCRVGDRRWTDVHLRDDGVLAHIPELCATMPIRSVVAVDGKVYAMTELGKLLIVESFLPQLNISVLDVGGIPPEDPFHLCFMVESGGDILCMLDDPDEVVDISGMGSEAWADGHRNFVAYRLDLPARQWVRADDALGDGSGALLLNYYGDSLSWEAGGSGDEGRIYARCWGSDSELITVYHMKHGLVEHRGVPFARVFFLTGACYFP